FITNPLHIFGSGSFWTEEVLRLDVWRIPFNFLGEHSILILADLFALFWIVWVINMVNFSSGVDGQMPGIVLVTLFVLFAASLRFAVDPSQLVVAKLALIGAGATFGFLIYNFYPAKIFPGDSASYFLGFLIAVVAILSGAKVGAAILVMTIPLVDGVFTIFRRLAIGKSPFSDDRNHLQHLLLGLGWGQRRIALFYWLLCAILGAVALLLPSEEKLFAGAVVAVIVIGGLLWLNIGLSTKARG
ncbi:MAG: glycosyl transferase family protein, partial [uncultured bacterium]